MIAEREARVAAEDVEEIAVAAEIQHQAGAAHRKGGIGAAGPRRRLLVADVELGAHDRAEKVSEPPAAPDLVVEIEEVVVAGERRERAELELMGTLSDGKCRKSGENEHQQVRPRAHDRSPEGDGGGERHSTLITGLPFRNPRRSSGAPSLPSRCRQPPVREAIRRHRATLHRSARPGRPPAA